VRAKSVLLLNSLLSSCCGYDETGHLHFLSQQIVADVEELFDDPFGKVVTKGIIAGNGGEHGFSMLKNGGQAETLEEALDVVINYVYEVAPKEYLEMLGYKKRVFKGSTTVTNMVNGRPFNASDAEHFLCKVWLIAKYTTPHYCSSKQPVGTKPHCHPMKLKNWKMICPQINMCMERALELYKKNRSSIKVPAFCLMSNEEQQE
jgi:hypothetical protein